MVKRKQNEPIQANRGGETQTSHALKWEDDKGGGVRGEGRNFNRHNTTIKQTDEKEHLARCSRMRRWRVSNCRAPHHQTNGGGGEGSFQYQGLSLDKNATEKKKHRATEG